MLNPTSVFVAVAILTLIVPAVFLAVLASAFVRRSRGTPIGRRATRLLAFLGGLSLGMFVLVGGADLVTAVPLLAAVAILVVTRWRRRRRVEAGWILLAAALPWTLLWGLYLGATLLGLQSFEPGAVWLGFAAGAVPIVVGLALVARGDPPPPPPDLAAPAGEPGSRAFGSVAAAIREPSLVGPFGASEVAAFVAIVLSWTIVPFLVPSTVPRILAFLIPVVVGAVLATEAYIRAMPAPSRRAFEAFSWLGEWELRQARLSPFRVPTTRADAERWLAEHPEASDPPGFRAEVLALARRFDEARTLVEAMPTDTPLQRWERFSLLDLVRWQSGEDGDLAGLEAAAAEILPADGDDRLRAEVSVAIAQVRRRMADGRQSPGDAAEPLVDVRTRLGARADGQVGRALRRRLLVLFVVLGVLFGGLFEVLGSLNLG